MRSERRAITKRLAEEGAATATSIPAVSSSRAFRAEISSPAFLLHSATIDPLPPQNRNSSHHNSRNKQQKLLEQLRAALDHKEAQIASLRRHSDDLLKSLKLKDLDIQHLQQALEDRDLALLSREKLIDQTKQRLLFQRKSEKVQIDKKDLEIAFLKAKSIRQDNKLIEQSKLLSTLHNQKEKMQQDVYAYSQHVKKKVHKLKENLQSALASIQRKDEEIEIQTKCIDDLKTEIWKKERLLEHIKVEQEKLQYALDRKDIICKQLQLQNRKLKDETIKTEESLLDLKQELQKDSRLQELSMERQKDQIQTLEIALKKAESFIHENNLKLQTYNGEKMRLLKEQELLSTKYDLLTRDHVELQMKLMNLEEQMNLPEKCSVKCEKQMDFSTYFPCERRCPASSTKQLNPEYPSLTAAGTSAFAEDDCKHLSCEYSTVQIPVKSLPNMNAPISCTHRYNVQSTSEKIDDIPVDLSQIEKGELLLRERNNPSYMLSESTISPRLLSIDANAAATGALYSNCFSEINPVFASIGDCLETKIASNNTVDSVHSNASLELQKIQEEIKNRESSWKQIEARMRAELNRRTSQLHEAEKGFWPLIFKERR